MFRMATHRRDDGDVRRTTHSERQPWRARPRRPVDWYHDHRLWILALVLPVAFTANGIRLLVHAERLPSRLEGIAWVLAALVIAGLVTLYLLRPVDEDKWQQGRPHIPGSRA
jgi:hypothetical protein